MYKIDKKDYCKFLHRFDSFDVIAIKATLCGKSKGTLYSDDKNNPNFLLLWNEFDGFYLSADKPFDPALVREMISKILLANKSENNEFVLYIDPILDKYVSHIIPADKHEKLGVLGYCISQPKISFTGTNDDYAFVNMDKGFFDGSYINQEEVVQSISETWLNSNEFLDTGFGVAVLHKSSHTIAAFCVTEHVTETSAEFSIETLPGYQRKGLATIAGQHMLSLCQKQGKNTYWYCTQDNTASIHLAEKLGFTQKFSFHVWLFKK